MFCWVLPLKYKDGYFTSSLLSVMMMLMVDPLCLRLVLVCKRGFLGWQFTSEWAAVDQSPSPLSVWLTIPIQPLIIPYLSLADLVSCVLGLLIGSHVLHHECYLCLEGKAWTVLLGKGHVAFIFQLWCWGAIIDSGFQAININISHWSHLATR